MQSDSDEEELETILARIRRIIDDETSSFTPAEATPVAKVNILLWVTGASALAIIGGAITLWQAVGGVETRLTRELGQVETRITQQIADVRSEVGEIRGRLSVMGQGPVPPR
jgi:hypothetical protein